MFLRVLFVSCLWWVVSGPASGAPAEVSRTLLILGDSLSFAYRMPVEQGWVALLERRLRALDYPYRVHNASIVGLTSGGALARMDALLSEVRPALTIVELGANDGLRARDPRLLRTNLLAVVRRLQTAGSKVLLLPMRLPPNYSAAYRESFQSVYHAVAEASGVPLGGRMLAGFAADASAFQLDGVHPTAAVQGRILENIWPSLEALLQPPMSDAQ